MTRHRGVRARVWPKVTQKHSASQLSNTFFFFMLVSPFPGASKGLSNNVRRAAAALAAGYLSLALFGRQFNP